MSATQVNLVRLTPVSKAIVARARERCDSSLHILAKARVPPSRGGSFLGKLVSGRVTNESAEQTHYLIAVLVGML